MRHTTSLLSISLLCFGVTSAMADGTRVNKRAEKPAAVPTTQAVEMPAPQSSVVVAAERGVRVWRPVTGEAETSYYPQAASQAAASDQQPAQSYASSGYGGYGTGGIYGAAGLGVNSATQSAVQAPLNGVGAPVPNQQVASREPANPNPYMHKIKGDGREERSHKPMVKGQPAVPREPGRHVAAPKPMGPRGKGPMPMVNVQPGGQPKPNVYHPGPKPMPMVQGRPGGQPKPAVVIMRPHPGMPGVHQGHGPMPVVYARAPRVMPKPMVYGRAGVPHGPVMKAPAPGRMAMGGGGMRPHAMAYGRHH